MDSITIQRLGEIRYQEIVAWAAQQEATRPHRRWTFRSVLAHLWRQPAPIEGPLERSTRPEPLLDLTAHERYN